MVYVKIGFLDLFKDYIDIKFLRSVGFMGFFWFFNYKYLNKLKDIKI